MPGGRDRDFNRSMDADIWTRVIKRRRQECTSLDGKVVQDIFQGVEGIETSFPDPCDQMEHLLQHHFEVATNPQFSNEDRRTSWSTVQDLLSKVDVQLRRKKQVPEINISSKRAESALSRVDLSATRPAAAAAVVSNHNIASTFIASSSASTTTSTPKAPPTITTSSISHHNGSSYPLSSSSRKESATTSTSPKSPRPFSTVALATASSNTVVTSHSAITSAPAVHPSMMASSPRTQHHLLHGTAAPVHPPPSYQRHSAVAVARMHEKESRKAIFAASKQLQPSSSLPVHPTFQRALSVQTGKATSQSPPIMHRSRSEGVSPRASPPDSSSSRTGVPPTARRESASNASTTNNANASTINTFATTPATTIASSSPPSAKSTNNANATTEASTTSRTSPAALSTRKRKNSDDMDTSLGDEGPVRRTKHMRVEASSFNKPKIAQQPKKPPEKPRFASTTTEMVLEDDPAGGSYSGSLLARTPARAFFRKQYAPGDMLREAGSRFQIWDPFWKISKVVQSGLTVPMDRLVWITNRSGVPPPNTTPKTTATFSLGDLSNTDFFKKIQWGKSLGYPKDGEYRLILRMLPVKVDYKKKRADCHLWPKGTFLTLNKNPIRLVQRKQQQHDINLWKGMCRQLDVGAILNSPSTFNRIDVCCYDVDQYFYSLAVCQYQSPDKLTKDLLTPHNPHFQWLSLEESTSKATQLINQQMVVEDDVDGGGNDPDVGKFIFSLVCPISKMPMMNPVRGRKCKHWQCFDLGQYMSVNTPVSGGRWRCASCETFVSHQELQLCGLTQAALKKFQNQVSSTRDRVEFRADNTYKLLPPQKLRYSGKKRGSHSTRDKSNAVPTKQDHDAEHAIVLIDSD